MLFCQRAGAHLKLPLNLFMGKLGASGEKQKSEWLLLIISKGLLSDKGIPIVLDFSPHSFYDRKELMVYFFQ
jgi:hypothetical protein